MPVTADRPAPYAPASTVIDVMTRSRDRGLPVPVDAETLGRIGVPDSLSSRVLYALISLDLIDEGGTPTATLESLRLAPEAEYKKRQEDWLKSAYADIFLIVDPAKDDETRVRDAFRGFNPVGQQSRMVSLFLGLCANAGMIPDKPAPAPRVVVRGPPILRPRGPPVSASQRLVSKGGLQKPNPKSSPGLPPALAGLLESLPDANDGWTATERDKFLTTFKAVLDFCIPVGKAKIATNETGGQE
jgi:hypothetical protein